MILRLREALLEAHVSGLDKIRNARPSHGWWHNTLSWYRDDATTNWGDEGRGPADNFCLDGRMVQGIFGALDSGGEVPTTDVFGCQEDTHFPLYFCSRTGPNPGVGELPRLSWDCFHKIWGVQRLLWLNSPVAFLGRVVRKLVAERARAIMVVPFCPAVWWFQELEVWSRRSVDVPILGFGAHCPGSRCPYPDAVWLGCEFGWEGSGTGAFLLTGVPGEFLPWVTEEPGAAKAHQFDGPWNGQVQSMYSPM